MSAPHGAEPGKTSPREKIRLAKESYAQTLQETHRIKAKDRSWIARWIIVVFIGTVAAALSIFVAEGLATGRWDTVAIQTFDLVRSTVLPVVTLILGYYFGRSAASEPPRRDEGEQQ